MSLALAPDGLTVDLPVKVSSLTGWPIRTTPPAGRLRRAALRAKSWSSTRPGPPLPGANRSGRTIAVITLRDQIITSILAGVRRPGPRTAPMTRARLNCDDEDLRTRLRTLSQDLAISTAV